MGLWPGISALQGMFGLRAATPKLSGVRIFHADRHGIASLSLEVANSMPRRAKGLMGRADLGGTDGMLFVYPWSRTVRIWMAGTHIPLDVLFVERSGRIAKIVRDMQPHSKQWVSSDKPVKWVIEIAAGRAAGLGLAVGDQLRIDS